MQLSNWCDLAGRRCTAVKLAAQLMRGGDVL